MIAATSARLEGNTPSAKHLCLQQIEQHFSQVEPRGIGGNEVKDCSLIARALVPLLYLFGVMTLDVVQNDVELTGRVGA